MINLNRRPPIVTNADRDWAIDQCPSWCRRGTIADDEIVDDGRQLDADPDDDLDSRPSFAALVAEEIEKFERYFNGQLECYGKWSTLWRTEWWPRVNPRKRFPKSAPKEFHPFFRAGSPEFDRALNVADEHERMIWKRFGVAQFKPDDPRLLKVTESDQPAART